MGIAAALAVLAAGAVHLWSYGHDGYSSIHVIGPRFLLNRIAAAWSATPQSVAAFAELAAVLLLLVRARAISRSLAVA